MNYLQLIKKVKQNDVPFVSLLYGTEPYFIQKIKNTFEQTILKQDEESVTYDLRETSIQEVIEDAETYPFFSEKKLIFVTNPMFLQAKPEKIFDEDVEHQLHALERYLGEPVDYSILVFIAPYEKIDQRKKLAKLFKTNGAVVECNPIKAYDQRKWVNELAKGLNIKLEEDVYPLFEDFSTDLQQLENELEKMSLYVGENGIITKEVAEQLMSQTTSSSSLKLADAVMTRNLAKAISIYKDLEKMKEEPIALIGLLAYQFRNILRVKLLKQKGYHLQQIQKNIGGHPYPVKIAYDREKQFTVQKLENIMDEIASADASIKQGKMESGLVVEMLLYNLIRN